MKPDVTWGMLHERIATGLTVAVVRDARALLFNATPWLKWTVTLPAGERHKESRAQVEVLHAIRQHLRGHDGHGPKTRHYVKGRDVVATGLIDDNGVQILCPDAICRAWFDRETLKPLEPL